MRKQRHEELYRFVGERIRLARVRRNLSQAQLGIRIGLSRVSVVNIEKGRQHPPLHVVVNAAAELDIPVTDLIPATAPKGLDVMASVPAEYRGFVNDILVKLSSREETDEIERRDTRSGKKNP